MCGRFTLHTPVSELVERFALSKFEFDYSPQYNIAPSQSVLTVLFEKKTTTVSLMRWGLVSPWQKDVSSRRPLINARLETLSEKPTFRGLINSKRCLIIADGYYEWKQEDSTKYPIYITLDQGKPFAFAALWDNEASPSCTIVTKEASPFLQSVHHRMPLILTPDTEKLWLSSMPFRELQGFLPHQEDRPFQYHRVSTFVNSPKNNDATCISPFDSTIV